MGSMFDMSIVIFRRYVHFGVVDFKIELTSFLMNADSKSQLVRIAIS